MYDIAIIGGGPIGLFAAATAGEMGADCCVIDSRPQLGGILMAAYSDKDIYDFPGFETIKGRDLINQLINKAKSYDSTICSGEYVNHISNGSKGTVVVKSSKRDYLTSAVIITTGLKASYSSLMDYIDVENWDGTAIFERWPSADFVRNKKIATIYSASSDLQLPMEILETCAELILVIDDGVPSEQIAKIENSGVKAGAVYKKPWVMKKITGSKIPQRLALFNSASREERSLEIDAVVGFFEGQARQTVYSNLGIEMIGQQIKVDQRMQTSMKRVYAAGDVAWYPGKLMLLATGIREANTAVKNALRIL